MSKSAADAQVIDAQTDATTRPAYVEPHEDEGHSVAGWIGVIVMLIGIATIAVALFFDQFTIAYIGAGIVAVGIILWPILKAAGLGPKKH